MKNPSLRELRAQISTTNGKPLPTAKALRESGSMVVASASIGRDGELCVYQNGFFLYKAAGRVTVGAVDRCDGYVYDGGDELDATLFEDAEWTVRLMLEGEGRLEHNNEKRHGNTFSYSGDTVEGSDLRDSFDLAALVADRDLLERALCCLTEKQRQAVELRFVNGLTQQEIGVRLGCSQRAIAYLLEAAMRKMKKCLLGTSETPPPPCVR